MTERSTPHDPSVDAKAQSTVEVHNFQILTGQLRNTLGLFGGETALPSGKKENVDYIVVNPEDSEDLPQLLFHASGYWSVRKPNAQLIDIHDILKPRPNNPDEVLRFYAHKMDPDFAMTIAGRIQDVLENASDEEIFSGQGVVFEEAQKRFKDEEDKYLEEKRILFLNRINAGLHAGLGRVLGVDRAYESAQRNKPVYPSLHNIEG